MRRSLLIPIVAIAAACQGASGEPAGAPRAADIALSRDANSVEARVPRNATLESLLRKNQLSADMTAALISAVRGVFDPRDIRANQTYGFTRSLDGLFREFRYQIDADRLLRVAPAPASDGEAPAFDAEVVMMPKEMTIDAVSATIGRQHASLVGALDASGHNIQLALQIADIFAGEVDFNVDLQPGDRIDVLFERAMREGEFIGYGDIKAAVLVTDGRRLTAIRSVGPDGKPGWYDEQGRSLRRQFLQSPLPFEPRVTSRFSYRRLHPVLGRERAHLGVDYGAPVGTAVRAVASGVVDVAGWSGEAGRMIRIRHSGGYETAYLHLSSLSPGIRPGARVAQGDLIGRVGATGTVTGPHLDFRIIKNGTYVNPLTELRKMPKGEPIVDDALTTFAHARDEYLGELARRVGTAPSTKAVASVAVPGK